MALLLALATALAVSVALPGSSRAAMPSPTPYMGWNPYYGVGGTFDELAIKSVAQSLITSGLRDAGYRIVWLDFGWASGARDSSGQLTVDHNQWPDGMAGLTTWLHNNGFEAGIYTDAGATGCNKQGVGSLGHYQQDANTFAAWGFDAVKVDFCGAGQEGLNPRELYPQFASAVSNNSSGRPMILNVCNFWTPGQIDGTNPTLANSSWDSYQWAPAIAQSWRTDTDIGYTRNIQFNWVLRNLDQDAAHPEAAGPGHWNDPDYLGPGLGMTDTEAQSQFSMWAMLAAPLILGSDPRALSSAEISMLANPGVISIDQDSFGAQATLARQSGSDQVWIRPLANGDTAVALFNRGNSASTITTGAGELGLAPANGYQLQDLWQNTFTTTTDQISAEVPSHGVVLYRVTLERGGSTSYPAVTTQGPSSITATGAGLNGTAYPDGVDTQYFFQYGTSASYGSATTPVDAGSGTAAVAASDGLSGLEPGTSYHYRLCVGQGGGAGGVAALACGEDQQFVTLGPTATTTQASGISATGAVLNGMVNANGAPTTYRFEYSTDPSLHLGVVDTPMPDGLLGSGSSAQPESQAVGGLRPRTTYHFRVVASSGGAAVYGTIGSFQTLPLAPSATTGLANRISATGATLNGSVNPNGAAASYHFEYSTDRQLRAGVMDVPQPGASAGFASSAQHESRALGGLRPNTTYYFRIVAGSLGGTSPGATRRFTTAPRLSGLSLRPLAFHSLRVGASIARAAHGRPMPRSGGAHVTYTDSASARTTFTVFELLRGVRLGRSCRKASGRQPRQARGCLLTVARGSFSHVDKAGPNSFRFTGRLGGRPLAPGRYVIMAVAIDRGRLSSALTTAFRILG